MSQPHDPPSEAPETPGAGPAPRTVDRFLGDPTRDVADWRWLWEEDVPFPVRSHRGGVASKLLAGFKKLLRPLVKLPLGDLHDRQRTFNLIVLEHLERLETLRRQQAERIEALDVFVREALDEALAHNDALYARADQKLDRYRAEAADLTATLGSALAVLDAGGGAGRGDGAPAAPSAALAGALDERAYLELERRYRGSEEDVAQRLEVYLPYLRAAPPGLPVLDLGCGRGEALAVLAAAGIPARGVDANARMVERCREQGLEAAEGDLFAALAAAGEGSLAGVVSFPVVEHLPPAAVDRLVRLAWRALAPGGVLVLETPNPLSVVVVARNFWLDPTHVRPVHPDTLRLLFELAGFAPVEHLELRPFPPRERLPEIDLEAVPASQRSLADRVNRLRDRLDELLFGYQDYAVVGTKGGAAGGAG